MVMMILEGDQLCFSRDGDLNALQPGMGLHGTETDHSSGDEYGLKFSQDKSKEVRNLVEELTKLEKKVGLQGVIRGTGILCSCTSCRGEIVVSIYQFEVHAGSTNTHPSNFIFFQNGKNLRGLLRSCIGVSLDMLEDVIQNAIDPLSTKKLYVCEKCKVACIGRTPIL